MEALYEERTEIRNMTSDMANKQFNEVSMQQELLLNSKVGKI
jgi:hypothetical protein